MQSDSRQSQAMKPYEDEWLWRDKRHTDTIEVSPNLFANRPALNFLVTRLNDLASVSQIVAQILRLMHNLRFIRLFIVFLSSESSARKAPGATGM
jgi:hypothetical protein